jgi:hypothetical protein
MERSRTAFFRHFAFLTALALALLLLLSPQRSFEYASAGLNLAALRILPSLFPFSGAGNLAINLGLYSYASKAFGGFTKRFFRLPGAASAALLAGIVGGYPCGAQTLSGLLKTEAITVKDASRALFFCDHASPSFVIGVVGVGIFGSVKTGAIILCVLVLMSLACGAVFCAFSRIDSTPPKPLFPPPKPFAQAFTSALSSSALSMLKLCACIVFFSCVAGFVNNSIFRGLLELTNGISALHPGDEAKAAFFLSFGGASILMQAASFFEDYKINYLPMLAGRFIRAAIAAAVCKLIFN